MRALRLTKLDPGHILCAEGTIKSPASPIHHQSNLSRQSIQLPLWLQAGGRVITLFSSPPINFNKEPDMSLRAALQSIFITGARVRMAGGTARLFHQQGWSLALLM